MMKYCIVLILFLKCIYGEDPRPIVTTPLGQIRGTNGKSEDGHNYFAFKGVPYATPPLGYYRFRPSAPVKPWNGIWEADTYHSCIQYLHYIPPGLSRVVEDCLYLNVFTPDLDRKAKLDVIVYIHGGAFMYLSGDKYRPDYLMNRRVVYVSINYRLGPIGFLCTEDSTVSGNMGMKDQVRALLWIKKYISYFGGNPNSITITGMSAGGASVHLHYMSPLSRGLFNKGFSLSGTALNNWVLVENSRLKARQLASSLGCTTKNSRDMVNCLRTLPVEQIVANVAQFFPFLYNPFSPFGIVIEKSHWSKNRFLEDHPYNLLKQKKVLQLPWITSVCQAEGLYPAAEFVSNTTYLPEIAERWTELAPFLLDYNNTYFEKNQTKRDALANNILAEYLQNEPLTRDTYLEFVQLMGDRLFVADSNNAAKLHAQASTADVFYYYFAYRGVHSLSELFAKSDENLGVSHGDDTFYVVPEGADARSTPDDTQMSEMLLDFWTYYAKTGVAKISDVPWSTVSKDANDPLTYMEIDSPTIVHEVVNDNLGRKDFWLSMPFKENKNFL